MNYKKILIFICMLLVGASIFSSPTFGANCKYNGGSSIGTSLDGCLRGSSLVDASGPTLIEGNVKYQIIRWTTALAGILGLFAVGAIVYGSLLMTLSGGEEEKIKKGKDVVKWSILGFLGIVVAGGLVRIIIELIFSFTA